MQFQEWQEELMAIIKHIANKNRNYGDALNYLMFKHDEFTQQPLLDKNGSYQLRDEYYLEGLNCEPFSFSAECEDINASFCKNYSEREIKSHHYIISFDPRDSLESGLTGEDAQRLGMEFAKKYFAGHQALICTHTDGHNESGNIHVHIILNSVRKLDIEETDFTERPCDSRAGFKHHVTDRLLENMKQYIMDMCQREHLHQVDLLSPAAENITEREYWKEIRDQRKLDKLNESIAGGNDPSTASKFQTDKQFLREAILDISAYTSSIEEFGEELEKRYGIKLKVSRGRYSYLHPDRSRYITGRNLGSNYTEEYLNPLFEGNRLAGRTRKDKERERTVDKARYEQPASQRMQLKTQRRHRQPDYDPSYDYFADPIASLHFYTKLRLVVDLQTCAKAQLSRAYAQKVKLTNLQQMAQTICFAQENGFDIREDVTAEISKVSTTMNTLKSRMEDNDARIRALNEQIHFAGQLYVNRNIIHSGRHDAERNIGSMEQFRHDHAETYRLLNEAQNFFRDKNIPVPNLDDLKRERDRLLKMKQAQRTAYGNYKKYYRELQTATSNINAILATVKSQYRNREEAQVR